MSLLDTLKSDMNELIRLVRASERYGASIAIKPELASEASHATEIEREHRIVELKARLGVTA